MMNKLNDAISRNSAVCFQVVEHMHDLAASFEHTGNSIVVGKIRTWAEIVSDSAVAVRMAFVEDINHQVDESQAELGKILKYAVESSSG